LRLGLRLGLACGRRSRLGWSAIDGVDGPRHELLCCLGKGLVQRRRRSSSIGACRRRRRVERLRRDDLAAWSEDLRLEFELAKRSWGPNYLQLGMEYSSAGKGDALFGLAEKTDLFVEIDPNQKERIVEALRRRGHVVGYLGDGINGFFNNAGYYNNPRWKQQGSIGWTYKDYAATVTADRIGHFYNDGFNVHGAQRHLVYQNIAAIECGDDGFSAHASAPFG
jgi:hypothetical protein